MRRALAVSATLAWLALAACGVESSSSPPDAADGPLDAAPADAVAPIDASVPPIDAAVPPDPPGQVCVAPPPNDGDEPPGPDGCATPPTGDWIGTASSIARGSGSQDGASAQMRWTLAESAGCVDRYRPSGTASDAFYIGCCCDLQIEPRTAAIDELDGELVIDRSTAPATYRVTGTSTWAGTSGCSDETHTATLGGGWANGWGSITGDVIGGSRRNGSTTVEWRFTREGATFDPPGDCSVPPREGWTTTFTKPNWSRTVTWIRTTTNGCLARYAICGESGGHLTIDRSVNPPTFSVSYHEGAYIDVAGVIDGVQFAGGAQVGGSLDWQFTEARCGSPSCFGPPPAGGVAMTEARTGAVPDLQYQELEPVAVVPGTRFVARLGARGDAAPHVMVGWNAPSTSTTPACVADYGAETCDLDVPATATTAHVTVYAWNRYDDAPSMPYTVTLDWTRPE